MLATTIEIQTEALMNLPLEEVGADPQQVSVYSSPPGSWILWCSNKSIVNVLIFSKGSH
jgi:hypothetical protein